MAAEQHSTTCWSASVTDRNGSAARVYERYPGSQLQVSMWVPGHGLRRVSLRHKDRKRAKSEARVLLVERPIHVSRSDIVTLGGVLGPYHDYLRYHDDGTEKASSYLRDCETRKRFLLNWFGPDFPASRIRSAGVREYARARRAGEISGRRVRTESIRADLVFLKGALRWATTYDSGDDPLLEKNPLEGFKVPKEKDPRQPLLDDDDVATLLAVAHKVHDALPLLLLLAETTGRRISSVLGLRWSDIDFAKRVITWRAELDKKRRGWFTPIPRRVLSLLRQTGNRRAVIGNAFVFPSSDDPLKSVSRHTAAAWLKRAFRKAGLPRPDGSLWHCLRRKWATDRRHLPLADVLAAAGWGTSESYLRHYAKATLEGMRKVVDLPRRRTKSKRRMRSARPKLRIA